MYTGPLARDAVSESGVQLRDGQSAVRQRTPLVSTFVTYDKQVAFEGFKKMRLVLGMKNVLEKDPPIFVPASNQFQSGYDVTH
jgi:iron complex outermembrane recepter protein